jgi:hypothetical protein
VSLDIPQNIPAFLSPVQTPDYFSFERFFTYTARIRFGHPNGVTKAPRTRHLCKNLSLTEPSENWFNNLIQPPIPAILPFGHVGRIQFLGIHFFILMHPHFFSNQAPDSTCLHPTLQYLSPKKRPD